MLQHGWTFHDIFLVNWTNVHSWVLLVKEKHTDQFLQKTSFICYQDAPLQFILEGGKVGGRTFKMKLRFLNARSRLRPTTVFLWLKTQQCRLHLFIVIRLHLKPHMPYRCFVLRSPKTIQNGWLGINIVKTLVDPSFLPYWCLNSC